MINTIDFPGRLLAFDTSTAAMSIAILENGQLVKESHIHAERNHSLHLMPMIQELMQSTGMKLAELSGLAVGVGPGSYTGVRIGVTAAKTLAWTLKLPLIGISSLEAIALGQALAFTESEIHLPSWIVPLMDARRAQVYTGLYATNCAGTEQKVEQDIIDGKHLYINQFEWNCLASDGIRLLEGWLAQLAQKAVKRIIFVGELSSLALHLQHYKAASSSEVFINEIEVQAYHIGLLASRRLALGVKAEVHQLIPNYTQLTEAEVNLLAKSH
jgi:tRNA threonylcarbamoyladenosine biosynthesis protein TsaB